MKSKSGVGTKIKFISHIEKIVGKSVKQLEWYIYAINHPAKVQGSIFLPYTCSYNVSCNTLSNCKVQADLEKQFQFQVFTLF